MCGRGEIAIHLPRNAGHEASRPSRPTFPHTTPVAVLDRSVVIGVRGLHEFNPAPAEPRSQPRPAADARRSADRPVHATVRDKLRQSGIGLAGDWSVGHRIRPAALAAAGHAAERHGTARRHRSQRRARVAQHLAGAGAGLSPARHPRRRSLRRRGPRPLAQRNDQPPRRLGSAGAAHRNGRPRRTNPSRQRLGHRRRAGAGRPVGRPQNRPGARHARPNPRRRRSAQVALARLGDRPPAPIRPHERAGGLGHQPSLLHPHRRAQAGRGHAQDRRVRRTRDASALQGQRRTLHARGAQHPRR